MTNAQVAVARGDGIGPNIMDACLRILDAAGARLDIHEVTLGEQAYNAGYMTGVEPGAFEVIRRAGTLYKAPLTTPLGHGYKSVNVTLRKSLGLFANVRPCRSLVPVVPSRHPALDVVIIRENEEDLYAGIEHRQTEEVEQCLKLITRPGSERLCRYAFEWAKAHGRQRVSCFVKDNIMKRTDGLFKRVFLEIAADYPEIEHDSHVIDIGTARIADNPGAFDVVVLPNLYGDIVSDVVAQLTGSVGLAGSANLGSKVAMFEAVHGSAPDIAGRDIANPSGLLQAGVLMMQHLGQPDVAAKVCNAWAVTLEKGIHTPDLYTPTWTHDKVGTTAFADAVIANLDQQPRKLPCFNDQAAPVPIPEPIRRAPSKKVLRGVDAFLCWDEGERDPNVLGEQLSQANGDGLELVMMTNRGQKVWPNGLPETFCTDHWRCRFEAPEGTEVPRRAIPALLQRIVDVGLEPIKTENLYTFDGELGYSLGQGQ